MVGPRGSRIAGGVWALLGGAALLAATVAPAGAQEATRPPTVAGQARGKADVFSSRIQISGSFVGGGLSLGLSSGTTLADAHDDVAASEARVLDYGLVDNLNQLPTPACPDVVPLFDPATLPGLIVATSSDPAGQDHRPTAVRFAGWPTYGPEAGVGDAWAGPSTSGSATTDLKFVDGGVITAYHATSQVTSEVHDGSRRVTATVTADSLEIFGGIVTLYRPTWTAVSQSGTSTDNHGTFDVAGSSILGVVHDRASTMQDAAGVVSAIEGLLGFLGLHVDWPQVTVEHDPAPGADATYADKVTVSPLRLRLSNMPIGRDLIGPLLRTFGPQIDRALDRYLADPCANPSMKLIVDVARGFASGVGEVGFTFGGVSAETNDQWVAPPVLLTDPPADQPAPPVDLSVAPVVAGVTDSQPFVPVDPVVVPGVDATTAPPAPTTTVTQRRPDPSETASAPVRLAASRPAKGTTGGAPLLMALVVLGGIAALAIADRTVMTRRPRQVGT